MTSEIEILRADNERLRWRHALVLPEWNDLPEKLRTKLAELGRCYTNEDTGGDFAVNFYDAIREAAKCG